MSFGMKRMGIILVFCEWVVNGGLRGGAAGLVCLWRWPGARSPGTPRAGADAIESCCFSMFLVLNQGQCGLGLAKATLVRSSTGGLGIWSGRIHFGMDDCPFPDILST
jgi:hypothetical protein